MDKPSVRKVLRKCITIPFFILSNSSSRTLSSVAVLANVLFTAGVTGVAAAMTTSNSGTSSNPCKVIDSHLHVWASSELETANFPYAPNQIPPESLQTIASTDSLLEQMNTHGVDGALIVQPINHLFDHSYILQTAIKKYPEKFKGMLLHDPTLAPDQAVARLEELVLQGFHGVRFNPYLWPKQDGDDSRGPSWTPMSTPNGCGLSVYRRCGELGVPVGIMCFQGLHLHYDDIVSLLESSPKTTCILDHFAFTSLTEQGEQNFKTQLLPLARKYPQVIIKISALFRLQDHDTVSFEKVRKERFEPLMEAFGADRLMFGTDFPFVTEQKDCGMYGGTVTLVSSWLDKYDESQRRAVLGGTAERVFGHWG